MEEEEDDLPGEMSQPASTGQQSRNGRQEQQIMSKAEIEGPQQFKSRPDWPEILDRYIHEVGGGPEHQPLRTSRLYHGHGVTVWFGRVHI